MKFIWTSQLQFSTRNKFSPHLHKITIYINSLLMTNCRRFLSTTVYNKLCAPSVEATFYAFMIIFAGFNDFTMYTCCKVYFHPIHWFPPPNKRAIEEQETCLWVSHNLKWCKDDSDEVTLVISLCSVLGLSQTGIVSSWLERCCQQGKIKCINNTWQ